MDVEEDIQKIQNFLERLQSVKPTESCTTSQDLGNLSADHHDPNAQRNIESRVELEKLRDCLKKNVGCQSMLSSLESSLLFLIEECLKEQKVIREKIDAYESKRICSKKMYNRTVAGIAIFLRKVCSSPYFKDSQLFPVQYNEDVRNRNNQGYLNPWDVVKKVAWTEEEKRSLERSIKKINKENNTSKQSVSGRVNTVTPLSDSDKYDWIKISVVDLQNTRSPLECRAIWVNYLHPTINKKRWTEAESKSLQKLVRCNQFQNWEKIAHDLETGRSAYQCIGYFKIKLADYSKLKWTEKESSLLEKLTKKFQVGNFTPWFKITWLMEGRNTEEVCGEWMSKYGQMKRGHFSLEEDIILVAGLKEFGEDWCRIAEYLPYRQSVQARSRLLVLKGRESGLRPWTLYEDNLLEELVQKYGFGNWTKISSHFLSRNNSQVRSHYKSLSKRREKLGIKFTPRTTEIGPKDDRTVEKLWQTAQKLVKEKNIVVEANDSSFQGSMIYALSKILKPRKKVGRKKGSITISPSQRQYYNFFHVAHCQRGGRGKDTCLASKVPTLVFQVTSALQLLDAKIILNTELETINQDKTLLEMDKSVLKYLCDNKEYIEDKCNFIQFGYSSNSDPVPPVLNPFQCKVRSGERYPICPPSATTMIGLRTMLLNRSNIREQSKGITLQTTGIDSLQRISQNLRTQSNYQSACMLWNKRIGVLYTWAAFISKVYPHEKFDLSFNAEDSPSCTLPRKTTKRGRRKVGRRKQCKSKDSNNQNEDAVTEVKVKRVYVKSGKFKPSNKVIGCERRKTRLQNKSI